MAEALFDNHARQLHHDRARSRSSRPFLVDRVIDDWLERLAPIQRPFEHVLVTGVPPALQPKLEGIGRTVRFAPSVDVLAEEGEASLDLLLVMGELDQRDELPLLLRILATRLTPGGLLAGAVPGGQSLPMLRAALHVADRDGGAFAARTHPRIEPGALATLLGDAGLTDAVVDIDRVILRYRSLDRLVADLRDHGVTNSLLSRPRRSLGKARAQAARSAFAQAGHNGVTDEQVDLLHFAAWKRKAS